VRPPLALAGKGWSHALHENDAVGVSAKSAIGHAIAMRGLGELRIVNDGAHAAAGQSLCGQTRQFLQFCSVAPNGSFVEARAR
jgi:hypothetical protein